MITTTEISDRVDSLKDGVKNLIEAGSARAPELEKLIKDHPIAAVMIGFGAGYLVTRMIRR